MGIRIHKTLGYGLDDVKCKKYKIIDDRFNEEFLKNYEDMSVDVGEYLNFLLKQKRSYETVAIKDVKRDRYFPFTHDAEFGDSKIFLVTPIMHIDEWQRYDDLIDYYGEYPEAKTKAKIICNIFPYQEIPDCVKNLCEYCKVFKDPNTVKQFKPILYTYWS